MTTTTSTPAVTAPDCTYPPEAVTCCRRPMSAIEVTARGVSLVLHSCASCGRHAWERDGRFADRAGLLAGVKTFLEQPRIPTARRRRSS